MYVPGVIGAVIGGGSTMYAAWLMRALFAAEGEGLACKNNTAAAFWAAFGLFAILTIGFDTMNYSTIHFATAYLTFICGLVAVVTSFLLHKAVVEANAGVEALVRSYAIKKVVLGVFAVAFVIYLPLGLAIVCSFKQLSMADCQAEVAKGTTGLECSEFVDPDKANLTSYWDYSDCIGTNTLRAIFQHIAVLSLFVWISTWRMDAQALAGKGAAGGGAGGGGGEGAKPAPAAAGVDNV